MADDLSTIVVEFRDAGATAGLRSVRQAIQETGDATTTAGNALPRFYEGVEQAGLKAGGAERGMRRLEYGLTAIATQSLGAESGLIGAASRAAEAGLLFGYGSEGVLAIAAGIGAFGLTLKAIQAPLEAVTKGAGGLTKELEKLTASAHPGVAAMNEVLQVAQQLQQVQEDAKPTFLQELLGTGVLGLLGPLNGVKDQIDAQHILAQSAEATAKSLKPVLDELVQIGQTKDLLRIVATEMEHVADVGRAAATGRIAAHPAAGILGLDPKFDVPAHEGVLRPGTGLIGAQEDAIAKARGMGWSKTLTDATVESIDRDFTTRVGKALKTAGENLTSIPVLERMAHDAAGAVRASGVAPAIADALIVQIRADLLSAIETLQRAEGPSALSVTARARERALGIGPSATRFQAPPPLPLFGEPAAPDFLRTPNVAASIRQGETGALSSIGDLKALDAGAKAAAEFAKQLDSAAKHTEKFDVTIVGAIASAIAAVSSGTAGGILGGAGGLLSTLAAQPGGEFASLGLPGAILGGLGGLLGVFGSSRGPTKVVVSAYEQQALDQMKALQDQLGQLLTVININGRGQSTADIAYALNRMTRRDAQPRIPQGVGS